MRRGIFAIVLACFMTAVFTVCGHAQAVSQPPAKVVELMQIMNDPEVKAWIASQQAKASATTQSMADTDLRALGFDLRARFRSIAAALPEAPKAVVTVAQQVLVEARERGLPPPGLIIAGIVIIALAGEAAARRLFRAARLSGNPLVGEAVGELGPLLIFVALSAVVFLAVDWPQAFDTVIIHYLAAAVVLRIVIAVHAMAVTAGSLSRFMFRRVVGFSAVLLIGLATVGIARAFGIDADVRRAMAVLISVLLLAISVETILRNPIDRPLWARVLGVVGVTVLWLAWLSGLPLLFWALIYAAIFPKLLPAVDRLSRAFAAARWPGDTETSLRVVLVVRGVRAVVIGLAVAWLFVVWQVNLQAMENTTSLFNSIFIGLLKSVIVILIADLGWALAKAVIGRRLAAVAVDGHDIVDENPRNARLRTLLPIFQNALAATLLVVTALMVLAELGVEIGPLIAGAGVVGVAIGFGSQTLVKDVISGVFYLMDDAFRVGEYIQSGSYMGTVESFSLRSVRLRHHRGPVFTVPFGVLGAVQNMSRDWVIDKFRIRVHFDADIAKAKKLTKAVGAELLADEELGPLIIETVKMKGVEQIGEFGIELSFAFTAKPGNQSMIRRRAYVLIRKAFVENGIGFAQPTVHVGGDEKGGAAAGAHLAQMQKAAADAQQAQQDQA